jgi:hypothetical protein
MTVARLQQTAFRCILYFTVLCLLETWVECSLFAQNTAPVTQVGIAPYDSYSSGIDQLNLNDLGLHIDIPLFVHKSSRGGDGVSVHLLYDSTYYDLNYGWSQVPTPNPNNGLLGFQPNAGWRVQAGNTPGNQIQIYSSSEGNCSRGATNCTAYYWAAVNFVDETGYTHPFGGWQITTHFPTISTYAQDGSGYFLQMTGSPTGTVTYPSGEVFSNLDRTDTKKTDPNGNIVATSPIGDSINSYTGLYSTSEVSTPLTFTDTSNVSLSLSGGGYSPAYPAWPTSRNPLYITYTDANSHQQQIVITYKMYDILPDEFQFNDYAGYNPNARSVTGLVDAVTFPDGTAYHFTYQSTSYQSGTPDGMLASMTLPTGGTISYQNTWSSTYCGVLGQSNIPIYYPLLGQVSRITQDGATTFKRRITSTTTLGGSLGCPTAMSSSTNIAHADGSSQNASFETVFQFLPPLTYGSGGQRLYHYPR